jgi:hypothetical protein
MGQEIVALSTLGSYAEKSRMYEQNKLILSTDPGGLTRGSANTYGVPLSRLKFQSPPTNGDLGSEGAEHVAFCDVQVICLLTSSCGGE